MSEDAGPEQKVEVVKRMYEAFHRGDAQEALAHFDPDVRVDTSRRVDGGIGRGHDDLNAIISSWIGTFEDWREEIEELREVGDQVFVVALQSGRGKVSGIEIENRYAILYEVVGERITAMSLYNHEAEALEAAGATE